MSQPFFPLEPPPPPPPPPPPVVVTAPAPPEPSWAEQWSDQAAALADLLLGRSGAVLVLQLIGILIVQVALQWAIARWGARSGQRALSALARVTVRLIAVAAALAAVLGALLEAAPLFTAGALGLGLAGVAFSVGVRLQGWIGAWSMLLLGRIRLGDHLELGGVRGVVEQLGLLRLNLRTEAGGRVLLPTRLLTEASLEVSTPEQSFPVDLLLRGAPLDAAALDRARALAGLCPYRVWSSEVQVVVEDDRQLRIRLLAWSAAAAERAETYLRAALTPPE